MTTKTIKISQENIWSLDNVRVEIIQTLLDIHKNNPKWIADIPNPNHATSMKLKVSYDEAISLIVANLKLLSIQAKHLHDVASKAGLKVDDVVQMALPYDCYKFVNDFRDAYDKNNQ